MMHTSLPEARVRALIQACQREAEKAVAAGNPPFGCVITDAAGNGGPRV